MKKIHLTLIAALMLSAQATFGQTTSKLSGTFPVKIKQSSTGNVDPIDSCRVNYTYKTIVGRPGYMASINWTNKNEFTYNGTRVTRNDVKNYPNLLDRFDHIAPTKAKLTFTVMFYSDAFKCYIASAKSSMEIPYVEIANCNFGPQLSNSAKWNELFTNVYIGKQEKAGTVVDDKAVDAWIKSDSINKGLLNQAAPRGYGFGKTMRRAFAYTTRMDFVNVDIQLTWPKDEYAYIVNELKRIDNISSLLANKDTVAARDAYFDNRKSGIAVIRPTSESFWNCTVPSYQGVEKSLKEGDNAYQKGDYNGASFYYQKALTADSTIAYAKNRMKKIKAYQDAKASRNIGDLQFVYVDGNNSIKPFYISKTEITQSQWRRVMGTPAPNATTETRNCPVANISWNEAMDFIKKLNEQTEMKYRLLKSTEWEYAAKGGKQATGTQFAGSDNIDDVAWTVYNAEDKAHDVATKAPNDLVIYDMTGNVAEWVADKYDAQTRYIRGGSFEDDATNCDIAKTSKVKATYKSKAIGFRICLDE